MPVLLPVNSKCKHDSWWSPSASPLLLFLSLHLLAAHAGRARLTQLTETSCVCPDQQLVFECTAVGSMIQFTVWRGSALDCTNGISLRHGMFLSSGYANGSCNNGAVLARIENITENCYTSQLIINTSLHLDGQSVQCAVDNGSLETLINTSTIKITTASFSPPNDLQLVDVQPGQITLNWTSVAALCHSVAYNIITYNCGRCPSTTSNTTVTCTDVVASGQVCTVVVQVVVCGNLIGNFSTPVSVILKVPRVSEINSIPYYNHVTQDLQSITSRFEAMDSFIISDGFEDHVISYTVSYSDSTTGNICSPIATIPASMCHDRVCEHVFEVATSFCHPSTNITITVLTYTMLGPGETSYPIIIDSRNNVFDLDTIFDTKILSITCTFLNPEQTDSKKICRVSLGLEQVNRCSNLSYSLSIESSVANVLHLPVDFHTTILMKSLILCFVVTASDGNYTAETERMLTVNSAIGCNPNELGDGTVMSDSVLCDSPLQTVGIYNGIVCYTGTEIGSTAVHHCFDCGYDNKMSSASYQVRTCQPNGTWNGTVQLCDCNIHRNINASTYIAISTGTALLVFAIVFIVVTILLATSKMKIQNTLTEMMARENMHLYEYVDPSQIMKNVAYEVSPPQNQS